MRERYKERSLNLKEFQQWNLILEFQVKLSSQRRPDGRGEFVEIHSVAVQVVSEL